MIDRRLVGLAIVIGALLAGVLGFFTATLLKGDGGAAPLAGVDGSSGHPLRIEILRPSPGARLTAGDPVVVLVQAFDGFPVARYELWADGVLARTLTPTDPQTSAIARLSWMPAGAGAHALVVRAVNADGLMDQSEPRVVDVMDNTRAGFVPVKVRAAAGATAGDLAQAFGVTATDVQMPAGRAETAQDDDVVVFVPQDRIPAGYADDDGAPRVDVEPEPSPTGDDAAQAEPADGGADEPLPGGFRREDDPRPPASPADVAGRHNGACDISITWSDRSGDETAFRVYRFSGGGDFRRIADIAAREGEGRIVYHDRVIHGGHYEYYVAAINAGGESPGNIAAVDVPEDACAVTAPPLAATAMQVLQFEAMSMQTASAWDAAYCYLSLARLEPYARIPEHERLFLSPAEDGWNIDAFAAGVNRRVFGQDPGEPVDVRLECWARRGDEEPIALGSFAAQHPREEWDGRDLFGDADGFRVTYRIQPYVSAPRAMFAIEDPRIPAPTNVGRVRSGDIGACEDRADFSDGEEIDGLLALWACAEIPERLLMWDWEGNDDFSREDLAGFRIYYRSAGDPLGDSQFINMWWSAFDDVNAYSQVFPVAQPPCNEPYLYRVTAFVIPAGGGEELESPPSEPFSLERLGCDPAAALVEFELITLEVGLIDDGVSMECGEGIFFWACTPAPDWVAEAYGEGGFDIIHADGSATSGHAWGYLFWTHDCGGQGEIFLRGCLSFEPHDVESNQTLRWEDQALSLCQDPMRCGEFGPDHNVFRVELQDGDLLRFSFNLRDDDLVTDDTWCGTDEDYSFESEIDESRPLTMGPHSLDEWVYIFENIDWQNRGAALDDQDAPCSLAAFLNGEGLAR